VQAHNSSASSASSWLRTSRSDSIACKSPGSHSEAQSEGLLRGRSGTPVAIFLDGCFWHGCVTCRHTPKTRSEFWTKKFELNSARDAKVTKDLTELGFRVVRIWEHELRNPASVLRALAETA
jgi:hypothetical protein